MSKVLSLLAGITCVAVLAAVGWYLYSERQNYLAAERAKSFIIESSQNEMRRLKREIDEKRLTPIYCNALAHASMPDQPGQPIKTKAYFEDLKSCRDLDRLGSYELRQLQSTGSF